MKINGKVTFIPLKFQFFFFSISMSKKCGKTRNKGNLKQSYFYTRKKKLIIAHTNKKNVYFSLDFDHFKSTYLNISKWLTFLIKELYGKNISISKKKEKTFRPCVIQFLKSKKIIFEHIQITRNSFTKNKNINKSKNINLVKKVQNFI